MTSKEAIEYFSKKIKRLRQLAIAVFIEYFMLSVGAGLLVVRFELTIPCLLVLISINAIVNIIILNFIMARRKQHWRQLVLIRRHQIENIFTSQ